MTLSGSMKTSWAGSFCHVLDIIRASKLFAADIECDSLRFIGAVVLSVIVCFIDLYWSFLSQ